MKKIGLVGGLSYVSTLEYYRLINAMVRQELDGHSSARLVIESLDEREFLDKQKEDETEKACEEMIVDAVGSLINADAEVIALCANGLHRFEAAIREAHGIELINIAEATAATLSGQHIYQAGLLGVKATMEGDFYKEKLLKYGVVPIIPDTSERNLVQEKIVSELVLNQFTLETKNEFYSIIEQLIDQGSQGIILGCTEIPLLITEPLWQGVPLFSTTEIHCRAIVNSALSL
ncbi:amino acid racemase [Moritella sp. 5]|uniref:aspartate/glutamate racemase family protein n=1 Tax=Moritella sp. 5 TaxID=2746231 RepID=UPI001BA762E4|nr:amino acid racemase [Moritella sp. 5]QUM80310.1 amino acid racemase [Moritella sp. 5]